MLYVSVTLLLYAVLSGLVMVVSIASGARPWMPLAISHGALAISALALALAVALSTDVVAVRYGVVVLAATALGGFLLLRFHLRGRPPPWIVVVLHVLPAISGVGLLVFALLGS